MKIAFLKIISFLYLNLSKEILTYTKVRMSHILIPVISL